MFRANRKILDHMTQLKAGSVLECSKIVLSMLNRKIVKTQGGRWSVRLVRPFEKNLNLTIIDPTRTLKIQVSDNKIFRPTKVELVGPAPPAL